MSTDDQFLYSPRVIDPLGKLSTSLTLERGKKISLCGNEYTITEKLGQGGFGSVYKCIDNSGKAYAVKKITTDQKGTPCLFEASIMATFQHPSLNRSLMIDASLEGLYILQDMAKYDLSGLIRENFRNGTFIHITQLKNILYRVGKGIAYLHGKGMIHGDIKAHNILFYSDDDIRLSDFNLTTMIKWQPTKLHLCTSMYRPLEIWLNKNWTDKVDIWSFGCLMFEILYGKLLIPYQGENEKSISKRKYVNSILEWGEFNCPTKIYMQKANISYNSPNIPSELRKRKNNLEDRDDDRDRDLYINLMLRCLQITENSRPSIDTIISDTLFAPLRIKSEYKELVIKYEIDKNPINKMFYNTMESEISSYVDNHDKDLSRLATTIFARYVHINKYSTHLVKRVSVWIAKKLMRTSILSQEIPIDSSITKESFLQTELAICNALGFKLI